MIKAIAEIQVIENNQGVALVIFYGLALCYFTVWLIYKIIKWIRSNWQEAKRKAND